MRINYKKTILIVLLALIIRLPLLSIVNEINLNPYVRTLNYSILKDYPNLEFIEIEEENFSDNTSGYSDPVLFAITELKESNYSLEKSLKNIDESPYSENLKIEASKKANEIYKSYSLNAKFVSVSFQIIVLISLSYFILYAFEELSKILKKNSSKKTIFSMESKK